jgi:type IV pilus assembly protein PilV
MKRNGFALIEGLISLVILSIGILGLVGMQARVIQDNGESQIRSKAGFFATSLLGAAASQPEFVNCFVVNSTPSDVCNSVDVQTFVNAWVANVQATLPGSTGALQPLVEYDSVTGYLKVTLQWKMNSDIMTHNFIAVTEI